MNLQLGEAIKRFPHFLNATEWPEKFTCNYIEPGLVSYENEGLGKCYVDKPALEKMQATFIGKPVVDKKDHVDGMTPADLDKVAKGYVTDVYYADGWFWADFIVFDDKIKDDIKNKKYSVSCAYEVRAADDKGGIRNNISYDQEVLDGFYTHLAIVPNPRYNGAKILLNSVGGGCMKVRGWFKKLFNATAKNELNPEDTIDIDGEKVSVGNLAKAVEDETAEQEKLSADEANKPKEQEIGADSVIQVGGKEVTLQNAMDIYRKRNKKKNADETPEEKAAREKKEADSKKNADEAAAKLKEEEDKKNADEAAKKQKEEEDKKNADEAAAKLKEEEDKKNAAHFNSLRNASHSRHNANGPIVQVVEDKRAKGVQCYGPK
jgi:hypothetical protein